MGADNQQERLGVFVDIENPQRPYAGPLPPIRKRMRWSDTCGDAGSWSRAPALVQPKRAKRPERNSLSGEQLPPAEVTPRVNPAHNGEALTVCLVQGRGTRRRVMPWEALCLLGGMAP